MDLNGLSDAEREIILKRRESERRQEEERVEIEARKVRVRQQRDSALQVMSEALTKLQGLDLPDLRPFDIGDIKRLLCEAFALSETYKGEYRMLEREDREADRRLSERLRGVTRPYSGGK